MVVCWMSIVLWATQVLGTDDPSPLSPTTALDRFQLADGFRIELVAAEPEVIDPVAIAFDENGRLWVVEMIDYPNGPDVGEEPKSRVRVLEDNDRDGRFETARTFVDGLLFATGLQPWKEGVFVTVAGKLIYCRDTNGDGRADLVETWFTGFAELNQQLRANHPTFGIDNKIYVANGLRGGKIVGHSADDEDEAAAVDLNGMDFRFDPLNGNYDVVSGMGQFALSFDDFGNRFVCDNRRPIKHIVLEDRYLKRNSFLAIPAVFENVAPVGAASRIFPLSRNWTNSTTHAGQFTAACGTLIFRGDGLGTEFVGNAFICDPTGNLVHRDILTAQGATFSARAGREGIEFLASSDNWFRPVNLTTGPDGALYVVDMYRAAIEHPKWLPDEVVERIPWRDGDDRGRIYRVVAVDHKNREVPVLAHNSSQQLVALLRHANSWWRETAARLIYERQDIGVQGALEKLISEDAPPVAKVHALGALHGLGVLSLQVIDQTLEAEHPRLLEHAVRLSEPWITQSTSLQRKILALANHADDRLRFQVALTLGQMADHPETVNALQHVIMRKDTDKWIRFAIISSLPESTDQLLEKVIQEVFDRISRSPHDTENQKAAETDTIIEVIDQLATTVGSRQKEAELRRVLLAVVSHENVQPAEKSQQRDALKIRLATIIGLAVGIHNRGGSFSETLEKLVAGDTTRHEFVQQLFSKAAWLAQNPQEPMVIRRQALNLLRYAPFETGADALLGIAGKESSQDLRLLAIGVLAGFEDQRIGDALLADFESQSPVLRRAVLDAMLANHERTDLLLDAIEAERFSATELDPQRHSRLLKYEQAEVRQRAEKLLANTISADRDKVLASYQSALQLKASPQQGRTVFEKNCSTCHRVSNVGHEIGPNISDSFGKAPEALLLSILVPNQAIDTNYVSYNVTMANGKVHAGIISQETTSSITLKQAEKKVLTLLREDIEQVRSSGVSLMPEGLEKNIDRQQMADLISYIKNWQYIEGRVPVKN